MPHSRKLPPDPEGMNDKRAGWAEEAVTAFAAQTHQSIQSGSDAAEIVTDLLADLRHYADRAGIDWEQAIRMADTHYAAETDATGTLA